MAIVLRTYQANAVEALTKHPRYILADEPGLGKTYPAIAAAHMLHPHTAKLLVVPSYLMYQWQTAIHTYLSEDEPVYVMARNDDPVPAEFTGWVIVNYHTLMTLGIKKHPELIRRSWGVVIFDEGHRLRGRRSQWTKNAKHLKTEFLWILTGTPLVNNPGDIWTLLNLLCPTAYRSYWKFVEEWCLLEYTPWTTVVRGIKPGLQTAFYETLQPFMLRRKIADHLPEIPQIIPHFIPVALSPAVLKAHRKALTDWRLENPDLNAAQVVTSGGALVILLRKLTVGLLPLFPACTEKFDTVRDILSDREDQHRVVFTWFVETAEKLAEALSADQQPVFLITGHVAAAEREARLREWQETPGAIIVATMGSMQEGVNLQKAQSVVFIEHHYLPATIEQSMARVRRFGQTQPVNVYHVMARGTVDESVWRVMQGRHRNVQQALLEDLFMEALPKKVDKPATMGVQ